MHNRREIIRAGVTGLSVALAGGCGSLGARSSQEADSRLSSFHFPVEAGPHDRTFMQWPVSRKVYSASELEAVQRSIATVANAIAQFEPVVMLGVARGEDGARRLLSESVEVWDIPTDDLWCRDSGPTFVINRSGNLAVAHLRFNGWGNKQPHGNDARVAARVAERLGVPLLETGLVGEQGGVEHDGAGTLLAHASSWVNPNRNRLSQEEIGRLLVTALGGKEMIWAPGIVGADITDYHIDALARFVAPGHVLIQIGDEIDRQDPWSVAAHQTLRILEQATDAQGKRLTITRLPEPDYERIRSKRNDFVSSYINYYVCNGAVIVSQFGDRRTDGEVRDILDDLYPGREIVMLDTDPIGESGGGIHCATQQQPAIGRR